MKQIFQNHFCCRAEKYFMHPNHTLHDWNMYTNSLCSEFQSGSIRQESLSLSASASVIWNGLLYHTTMRTDIVKKSRESELTWMKCGRDRGERERQTEREQGAVEE